MFMYYTGNYTVFQTKYLMILHRIGLQQQHYYTKYVKHPAGTTCTMTVLYVCL